MLSIPCSFERVVMPFVPLPLDVLSGEVVQGSCDSAISPVYEVLVVISKSQE